MIRSTSCFRVREDTFCSGRMESFSNSGRLSECSERRVESVLSNSSKTITIRLPSSLFLNRSSTSIRSYSISCGLACCMFLLRLVFSGVLKPSHSIFARPPDSTCTDAFSLLARLRSLTMARTSECILAHVWTVISVNSMADRNR